MKINESREQFEARMKVLVPASRITMSDLDRLRRYQLDDSLNRIAAPFARRREAQDGQKAV